MISPTAAEIEAARTPAGGWTRDQLAQWGVPWPPPKGWKRALLGDGEVSPFTPRQEQRIREILNDAMDERDREIAKAVSETTGRVSRLLDQLAEPDEASGTHALRHRQSHAPQVDRA